MNLKMCFGVDRDKGADQNIYIKGPMGKICALIFPLMKTCSLQNSGNLSLHHDKVHLGTFPVRAFTNLDVTVGPANTLCI